MRTPLHPPPSINISLPLKTKFLNFDFKDDLMINEKMVEERSEGGGGGGGEEIFSTNEPLQSFLFHFSFINF